MTIHTVTLLELLCSENEIGKRKDLYFIPESRVLQYFFFKFILITELKFLFNELDYCIVCLLNYIVEG